MIKPLPSWDTHDAESLRQFARIRLVAADLDGTLLEPGENGSFETIATLLRSLRSSSYQVSFTIATGRTLTGVLPILKNISLPKKELLILYNGSVIVRNSTFEAVECKTISAATLQKILELASNFKVRILAYFYQNRKNVFFQNSNNIPEYVLGWSKYKGPENEFNGMPIEWQKKFILTDELKASAIIIDTLNNDNVTLGLQLELKKIKDVSFTSSGTSNIEIRPRNSNKGIALEVIAKHLCLSINDILAIGDNDNDLEMLATAGIGVAIGDASNNARSNSDFICKYGVAKGAVEVLRLIREARKFYFHANNKDRIGF